FVVAFLGAHRSEAAAHAKESPSVMTIPLVLLAIPAAIIGFPPLSTFFLQVPEREGVPVLAILVSLAVFLGGSFVGFVLYREKSKDPISIPLFANRFYIDEFYSALVKWTQDLLAQIAGFVDRWIIDGGIVRGLGGMTWSCGFALRFLQIGNLQAYAFLFGLGVVLLLYLILFAS
ncbi:MAG TPA: NADH-quinone oxidoreductase subunit L, partial [Chthoniobacterales bacterium]|nr:NADH-quinone oxidoreductase subunit L [Chthoniobacterales bacterium]